jgi:hypothetical protein
MSPAGGDSLQVVCDLLPKNWSTQNESIGLLCHIRVNFFQRDFVSPLLLTCHLGPQQPGFLFLEFIVGKNALFF